MPTGEPNITSRILPEIFIIKYLSKSLLIKIMYIHKIFAFAPTIENLEQNRYKQSE